MTEPQEPQDMRTIHEMISNLGHIPVLEMSYQELEVIDTVLFGYAKHLEKMNKLYGNQYKLLQDMQRVRLRIAHVQPASHQQAPPVSFAFEDLEVMADALIGFVRLVPRMVPKSTERDDVLQGLRLLRQKIETLLDVIIG